MTRAFQSLSDVLRAVIHRHGLTARLFECQLQQRWSEIAGSHVAAHSRPEQIRFRKLYLVVENSVWLQQLRFLTPTLLDNITKAAGEPVVSEIVLRVGEVGASPPATAVQPPPSPPPAIDAGCSSVDPNNDGRTLTLKDPELHSRFAALLSAVNSAPPRSLRTEKRGS